MKLAYVGVRMLLLCFAACGGQDQDACANGACACTPEAQGVGGTALVVAPIALGFGSSSCSHRLLASAADVASAFPSGDAPPELMTADFTVERVVLGSSNPALKFAIDDGIDLVVGEEMLCQGVAPQCTAYIVQGTTRNTLRPEVCPYTEPDPCLAP